MNIGYARVSSYDQKKDLYTQIEVLQQFANEMTFLTGFQNNGEDYITNTLDLNNYDSRNHWGGRC